jgi:hypothetical protein
MKPLPARDIASFPTLGRGRDEQVAIVEEIPDCSQVDGPICVLGADGSDVASSQQFLESWIKGFSRHVPLQSSAIR